MSSVAIVGFGLIGGSLAAGIRVAQPHRRIVAIDTPAVLSQDAARALADTLVSTSDEARVTQEVAEADVCVLAAPVSAIEALLPRLLPHARVLTDCGSTKRAICAAARSQPRAGRFVPGHPMSGGPEGGVARARPDLFQGQTWILCPEHADADALEAVEALVRGLGARLQYLSAAAHDRAVASTSHVPQIVLSALTALVEHSGGSVAAGPAYRAALRFSGGPPSMWRDVFATNADAISLALRELIQELEQAAQALGSEPPELEPVLELLTRSRGLRASQ